jgi:hypothetical protein
MRYLPGQPADIIQESISSYSLIKAMVNNPDIIPTVYRLWGDDITPLSAMLSLKGMKTKGLFDGSAKGPYRVVKSNHVQYAIENDDRRKMRIKAVTFPNAQSTATYYCAAYTTQPGYNQSSVYIGFDSNYAGPKTVLELDDNMTKIYFIDDQLPQEAPEGWIYECKIVAQHKEAFIDPELLVEGAEVAVVMDMYEHDFSETGPETNFQFDGWGHAYMTLQRVRLSYSGTAEAMGSNGALWTEHNGQKSFLTVAEDKMMRQAAAFHEYQILFGKGTVTTDGDVLMKDKKNREILAGDGIMHQNDGSYEYPYNKWSLGFLEGIMQDLEIRHNKDGLLEVILLAGRKSLFEFSKLMAESGFVTGDNNIPNPTAGAEKGVNNTYSYYEIAGVRIIPKLYSWLDSPNRPTKWLIDGTKRSSYDGFLIPIGNTTSGQNGIELVQLRPPKKGQVNGINVGGDMATSVDGSHIHYLFQTGVICRIKTARIFRPYPYTSQHVYFN